MKKQKIQIGIVGALICGVWIECILFGGLGLGAIVGFIATYIGVGTLCKVKSIPLKSIFFNMHFVAITAIALCFGLYDNLLLKFTNIIALIFLIGMHMQVIFKLIEHEKYGQIWLKQSIANNFKMPFLRQKHVFNEIKKTAINIEQKDSGTIKEILKGALIALPIMIIVTIILIFADAAFESTCMSLIKKVNIYEMINRVIRFMVWEILFLALMSSYHFCICRDSRGTSTQGELSDIKANKIKYWNEVSTFTVVILIASIYCVYICSQFNYFTGVFDGILPESYTYAMYARRGFFELIPIIIFNGLIVGMMGTKLELNTIKSQRVFRYLSTFYCIFTGFLIITAIAKMYLYMNLYGLTIKRLYVTWFLLVCFAFLICICIKLYKSTFKLVKCLFIFFVGAYIGLNYANVDKLAEVWNENNKFDKPINKWEEDYHITEDERAWYDWNLTYETKKSRVIVDK